MAARYGWSGLAGLFGGAMLASAAASPTANAAGVLTVATSAGDMAVTTGTPDQGFARFRFVGWNLYDALARWDLSRSDVAYWTPAGANCGHFYSEGTEQTVQAILLNPTHQDGLRCSRNSTNSKASTH